MLFLFFMIIVNLVIIVQPLKLYYVKSPAGVPFFEYGAALVLIDAVFFVIISAMGYNAVKRIER